MSETQNPNGNTGDNSPVQDENHVMTERREKLKAIRAKGVAFPNDFKPDALAANIHAAHGDADNESLEALGKQVKIAGRMVLKRVMGKASFATLQDQSGRIQLFVSKTT